MCLDEILINTGISDEGFRMIKLCSRKGWLTKHKLGYAKMALSLKHTYKEIAQNIDITESSVKDMIYKNEGKNREINV